MFFCHVSAGWAFALLEGCLEVWLIVAGIIIFLLNQLFGWYLMCMVRIY